MIYDIKTPDFTHTDIQLPSSKSISNRVLIINALSHCPQKIGGLYMSDDIMAMTKALAQNESSIDIGAAGTAMRFLTAYFATQAGTRVLSGTERMKDRPIRLLVDALRKLGASIEYTEKEGFPPLKISGHTLTGGEIKLDGGVSSQYISALLMIAPVMINGLRLRLTGAVISRPYIDLTVGLMRRFGISVAEEDNVITVPPQQYSDIGNFSVEADWSAASYWYEMMALCRNSKATVSLSGLKADSMQGDSKIADLFDKFGVRTVFTDSGVVISKKNVTVNGLFEYDFLSMPDMAQTVVVTCAMLGIPFRFGGLQSLRIKETDRLDALCREMLKLGFVLEIHNDSALEWRGERVETNVSPVIETYQDHRMAMAFAPAALCLDHGIMIDKPEVVTKSYPSFWGDLEKAGFLIKIND